MQISIRALDEENLGGAFQVDGEFEVRERLALRADEDGIRYEFAPCAPRTKRYGAEAIDLSSYLRNPQRAFYLAYANVNLAGQIVLRTNWNGYGFIDDIEVDKAWRRRGIGRALLEKAKAWCRERGLPGLMLETQDINAPACRLYAACGFRLEGFDRALYRGLDPKSAEIALFWYWKSSENS